MPRPSWVTESPFLEFLGDTPNYRENYGLKDKGVVILWFLNCFVV